MAGITDQKEITASYDGDTKRYHRYLIDNGQEIVGSLFIPKDFDQIPKEVIVRLQIKE